VEDGGIGAAGGRRKRDKGCRAIRHLIRGKEDRDKCGRSCIAQHNNNSEDNEQHKTKGQNTSNGRTLQCRRKTKIKIKPPQHKGLRRSNGIGIVVRVLKYHGC